LCDFLVAGQVHLSAREIPSAALRARLFATKENPLNDSDRFDLAVRQIVGKRLMYSELTGKVPEAAF